MRDRFLEEVERQPQLLEGQSTGGKYDVSRQIEATPMGGFTAGIAESAEMSPKMLDAA